MSAYEIMLRIALLAALTILPHLAYAADVSFAAAKRSVYNAWQRNV
jgi:hypothetical protein